MLRCGLLGEKLGHSYSPAIHRMLGDYAYQLYEIPKEGLESFLKDGDWDGLNVTIPYKKEAAAYCAELSDIARQSGSVNTLVRRPDGSIFGDNTDAYGFGCLLRKNRIDPAGKKVLILGNGGACASVREVLNGLGARTVVISRSGPDHYGNLDRHRDAEVIVNTTPVGMYPGNGESPVDLSAFADCRAVLDIIYNPARTALLMQAQERGMVHDNGLYMLAAQAVRSSELFTGRGIDRERIDEITRALSLQMQNIILIGMPGSGKTTIARILGRITGRQVIDADEAFAQKYHVTPEQCILTSGEAAFRQMETEVLRELGRMSGIILATGGGCVTVSRNYPLLHQNGVLIWIRRDPDVLPDQGRPLSARHGIRQLYEQRKALYERFADHTADNDQSAEQTVRQIGLLLGMELPEHF